MPIRQLRPIFRQQINVPYSAAIAIATAGQVMSGSVYIGINASGRRRPNAITSGRTITPSPSDTR